MEHLRDWNSLKDFRELKANFNEFLFLFLIIVSFIFEYVFGPGTGNFIFSAYGIHSLSDFKGLSRVSVIHYFFIKYVIGVVQGFFSVQWDKWDKSLRSYFCLVSVVIDVALSTAANSLSLWLALFLFSRLVYFWCDSI